MQIPRLIERSAGVEVIRSYEELATAKEQALDDFAVFAARICQTPMAFIAFLDGERFWFKSSIGVCLAETPRRIAFCSQTVNKADYFSIKNTSTDERFSTHPLVVSEPHIRFYAGVPLLTSEGIVIGTLWVADRIPRELSPEQRDSLWILSRQIISRLELHKHVTSLNRVLQVGIVLRQTAEESRVRLLHRLVSAHEEERGRIARELHDKMGQYLTGLIWGLHSLTEICQPHPPSHTTLLRLLKVTDELMREVHHLAWELRPALLDDLGLDAAMGNYLTQWSERNEIALDFHNCNLDKQLLSPDIETTVYRIVQEALTNILKHAQAKHVSVVVECQQNIVQVMVEDDGKGFDTEYRLSKITTEGRLGVVGMQERAAMVEGTLDIESTPGAGTTVFVRIPLPPAAAARGKCL